MLLLQISMLMSDSQTTASMPTPLRRQLAEVRPSVFFVIVDGARST